MLQPALVIMENVPGLADKPKKGGQSNIEMVKAKLNSLKYSFISRVFDAADTGIPQRRKRLWMAALRSASKRSAGWDELKSQTSKRIPITLFPGWGTNVSHKP